jgi:hypothetical protein
VAGGTTSGTGTSTPLVRRAGAYAVVLAVALAVPPATAAAAPPEIGVRGPADGCPASGAVAVALAAMLPQARVLVGGWDAAARVVRIEDLGERYRIAIAGATREEADPARDCAERARVAAVFVTLTLFPPFAPAGDAAPVSAPAPASAPSRPSTPSGPSAAADDRERPGVVRTRAPDPRNRRPLRLSVEATGLAVLAPASSGLVPATGGGAARVRLELWRGRDTALGVALGAGAAAAATLTFTNGRATVVRAPVDLGGYAVWRRGRAEMLVDLGLAGSALHVRGQDFTPDVATTSLEWSLRLGAALRLWLAPRLGVMVGLDTSIVPEPYALVVKPVGPLDRLGSTPAVWLDLSLGLCARFD